MTTMTQASTIEVVYDDAARPDAAELRAFYAAQGHPVPDSPTKLERMIANSVCFVTARAPDGRLIGFARGMADGVRGYLTECKLDPAFQGPGAVTARDGRVEHDQFGIARALADRVLNALRGMGCERIDVTAYGTEVDFCEELGFRKSVGLVPMTLDARDRPRVS
ncbi:MAG: GNAT family N-acetyltransferase [Phycisphaerae bacterium]|nr:GNAT family N-acetyltransferase [Phycisphaerae bacterium]